MDKRALSVRDTARDTATGQAGVRQGTDVDSAAVARASSRVAAVLAPWLGKNRMIMTRDQFRQAGSSRRDVAGISCGQCDRLLIARRRAGWCGRARTTVALFLVAVGIGMVVSPTFGSINLPIGENRVALVIGNNAYDHISSLGNAGNDAEDFATVLERYGFMVTLLRDADRAGVMDALQRFGGSGMVQADVALVYFAGHGMETEGVTYLLPVDVGVDGSREATLRDSIAIDHVFGTVKNAGRRGIVVFDANRHDPFAPSPRGRERVLSAGPEVAPIPHNLLVAYATSSGETAMDAVRGDERNSPYAGALLTQLTASNSVGIRRLFEIAARKVFVDTESAQAPVVRQTFGSVNYVLERP